MRLERLLARLPAHVAWRARHGYIVELGAASVQFLSADAESNVVGGTANLLLEIDEAQDFSEEKYLRDFRPMGSTANATTVLYGTAWSHDTLLANRAANLRDDPEADFAYPWTVLAELNPAYKADVSSEIRRLGEDHPIIKTQYLLEAPRDRRPPLQLRPIGPPARQPFQQPATSHRRLLFVCGRR